MLFLVDEDLSRAVARSIQSLGHDMQRVSALLQLRTQPDEVVFDYAVKHQAILVTGDVGIANPLRFPLHTLPGIILLRFPNEMPDDAVALEVYRLLKGLSESDFSNLIVVEPDAVRIRPLHL